MGKVKLSMASCGIIIAHLANLTKDGYGLLTIFNLDSKLSKSYTKCA